jgi:hypothetical protein
VKFRNCKIDNQNYKRLANPYLLFNYFCKIFHVLHKFSLTKYLKRKLACQLLSTTNILQSKIALTLFLPVRIVVAINILQILQAFYELQNQRHENLNYYAFLPKLLILNAEFRPNWTIATCASITCLLLRPQTLGLVEHLVPLNNSWKFNTHSP